MGNRHPFEKKKRSSSWILFPSIFGLENSKNKPWKNNHQKKSLSSIELFVDSFLNEGRHRNNQPTTKTGSPIVTPAARSVTKKITLPRIHMDTKKWRFGKYIIYPLSNMPIFDINSLNFGWWSCTGFQPTISQPTEHLQAIRDKQCNHHRHVWLSCFPLGPGP